MSRNRLENLDRARQERLFESAADEFAARFFGQGASLSFGVEVPTAYDEQKQTALAALVPAKVAADAGIDLVHPLAGAREPAVHRCSNR